MNISYMAQNGQLTTRPVTTVISPTIYVVAQSWPTRNGGKPVVVAWNATAARFEEVSDSKQLRELEGKQAQPGS